MMTNSEPDMGRALGTRIGLRAARAGDEERAAALLRASITELCIADHNRDQAILSRWLANKTADQVREWIATSGDMILAEENGQIVGLGATAASGEITLNYVAPQARFLGVSKALLRALEDRLRERGHRRVTLSSTHTAHRFYRAAGYVDVGSPQNWAGLTAFPMAKDLR